MSKTDWFWGAALLLSACAGGVAEPTAIPATIVRPEQPAPLFENDVRAYRMATAAAPLFPPGATTATGAGVRAGASPVAGVEETLVQRPSAMGIVRAVSSLYAAPDGAVAEGVALIVGATVTVTGRSADGRWLALFTADGIPGWLPANVLQLYGAGDLTTVDSAVGPGPIATLINEAMQPLPAPPK